MEWLNSKRWCACEHGVWWLWMLRDYAAAFVACESLLRKWTNAHLQLNDRQRIRTSFTFGVTAESFQRWHRYELDCLGDALKSFCVWETCKCVTVRLLSQPWNEIGGGSSKGSWVRTTVRHSPGWHDQRSSAFSYSFSSRDRTTSSFLSRTLSSHSIWWYIYQSNIFR